MKSKVLGSLLTALGLAWAANASAVVVGMVDFGVIGQVAHLEATTLAETLINADAQNLQGYGVVTAVNGRLNYCAAAAGNPNCRLYYYFTAYTSQAFTPANVQFRGGIVDVYYDPGTGGPSTGATRSLLDYSSPTNVAYITGLSHWVEFAGHAPVNAASLSNTTLTAFGTLAGSASVSFQGTGLLDVNVGSFGLASVQNYFNSNGIPDGTVPIPGRADALFTSTGSNAFVNPHDTCSTTRTSPGNAGEWCIQGTADIRGLTKLPEPGSLALIGLALGILGVVGRRRSKEAA